FDTVHSPGTIVYIDDREEPISAHHSCGELCKMAYDVADLSVLYSSLGDAIPRESGTVERLITYKLDNGRLVDPTSVFRADPLPFAQYRDSDVYMLTVAPGEVVAGRDSYSLRITG